MATEKPVPSAMKAQQEEIREDVPEPEDESTAVVEQPSQNAMFATLHSPDYMGKLAQALPGHLSAERMLQVAWTGIRTTPKLMQCSVPSICMTVMESAQLGLELSSVQGLAYPVPYKNKQTGQTECQLILGYQGLLVLARRSGEVGGITAEAVYQADTFEYSKGLHPDLKHIPKAETVTDLLPENLTHAYAVAQLKGQDQPQFVCLTRVEIDKVKAGAASKYGPWKDHYAEMAKKTALRRLCKLLPKSVEAQAAIQQDEQRDLGLMQGKVVLDPLAGAGTPQEQHGDALDVVATELESGESVADSEGEVPEGPVE